MAISRLAPAAAASTANTSYFTIPDSNRYVATVAYEPGVYGVSSSVSYGAGTVEFLDANDSLVGTASFSGVTPIAFSTGTAIKKVRVLTNPYRSDGQTLMGSTQVAITLVGALNSSLASFTGSITTYTSSQTVAINGTAYVFAVGGGGGGRVSTVGYNCSGGGSGALLEKYATNWSGNYVLTIGAGGASQGNGGTTTVVSGGTTILSAGGGYGATSNGGNAPQTLGNSGFSGTYDYAGGSNGCGGQNQGNGGGTYAVTAYAARYQWAKQFSVAGGTGGGNPTLPALINNGLASKDSDPTGRGNGGGGGANTVGTGGAVYVITGLQEL